MARTSAVNSISGVIKSVDRVEAKKLLTEELAKWRKTTYADLISTIGDGPEIIEPKSESGVGYQIEIEVIWDGVPGGDVRVIGSIDDGGLRAFYPVTDDFIVSDP